MTKSRIHTSPDIHTKLKEALKLSNALEVPKVKKIVVNAGVGRLLQGASKPEEILAGVADDLARITGQRPVTTKARKSIASFKVREGMPLGLKVTLRGKRMRDFLARLVHVALPRTRDFRGVSLTGVDEGGNLTIGLREQTVFPEVATSSRSIGLEISMVSTAKNREEATQLFRALGFPFKKEE